jgi:thioredoxin-related protein
MRVRELKEKTDLISNILTIVVAILVIGFFAYRYINPSPSTGISKSPTIGNLVSIDNLDTSKSNKNVLIVMTKGCRFCEESMDFYKQTLQQYQGSNIGIAAVFPSGSEDIGTYLQNHGVTGIDIKYSDLSRIEVRATPTIIVTDENGRIAIIEDPSSELLIHRH